MGVWEAPHTMLQARKLARLMAKPIRAKDVVGGPFSPAGALAGLIGDDGLYDVVADKPPGSDVRSLVADLLRAWDEGYAADPDNWRDPFETGVWETLRKAYRPHLPRGRSRFGRERPGKTRRKSRPKVARRQGRAAKPKKPPTPRKPSVPGRTGSLHRALGIPAGRKLPVAGLKRVARGRGKLAERARRALNLRGVKTKNMRSA